MAAFDGVFEMENQLRQVEERISHACDCAGRKRDDIKMIAVSKGQSVAKMARLYALGVKCFGENYLQEAGAKQLELTQPDIEWHFIGALQTNKAKVLAQSFHWVHSVASVKAARLLNEYRLSGQRLLNVCIQVNIDQEQTKQGVQPQEVPALAKAIKQFPRLKLRGLMCIPQTPASFKRMSILLHSVNETAGLEMDTLSMGMSADLEQAIEAGSTLIRIGTALFGERSL